MITNLQTETNIFKVFLPTRWQQKSTGIDTPCIGNESVPKILTNEIKKIFFLKLQSAF